ncbi:hypothetical protein WCLP8_4000030 [uncultured Gammaproteobacteria bacterium]
MTDIIESVSSARRKSKAILMANEQKDIAPKEMVPLTDQVRAHTTRNVTWVYGFSIVFIGLLIFFEGWFANDFHQSAEDFLEVIKIAVLPVVTFVLGRYFGTANR